MNPEEEQLEQYVDNLLAIGMEEREAARAYFYAQEYGLDALSPEVPEMCSVFEEPRCGDWNCVRPDHQILKWKQI